MINSTTTKEVLPGISIEAAKRFTYYTNKEIIPQMKPLPLDRIHISYLYNPVFIKASSEQELNLFLNSCKIETVDFLKEEINLEEEGRNEYSMIKQIVETAIGRTTNYPLDYELGFFTPYFLNPQEVKENITSIKHPPPSCKFIGFITPSDYVKLNFLNEILYFSPNHFASIHSLESTKKNKKIRRSSIERNFKLENKETNSLFTLVPELQRKKTKETGRIFNSLYYLNIYSTCLNS